MRSKFINTVRQFFILNAALLTLFSSCSVEKQIAHSAKTDVLDAKALETAHVGISIFDPATNKYLYNYQGDKYFVPASNIKIPTCYAAMKYLGDSLVGLRYFKSDDYYLFPTGDPTFLLPEYKNQPVFDFLSGINHATIIANNPFETEGWGSGWSWNDYEEPYQSERSSFPINANCIKFYMDKNELKSYPLKNIPLETNVSFKELAGKFIIGREIGENTFVAYPAKSKLSSQSIPFIPNEEMIFRILRDTLENLILSDYIPVAGTTVYNHTTGKITNYDDSITTIHSQPTDSLLKPMMHRSDNFFAEQSLLMVSNERLGVMNDEKIIDTLLKTDFKDLPRKPRWVDGSGLSRYNLFTPQDFVFILNKMKNEFGMERLKVILATGGEGTISSYYKADSGYIYAKTGTLSGVVAFSGFLYTKKGKLLIFSTLVNNHQASATDVRRAIEKFIQGIRNKY